MGNDMKCIVKADIYRYTYKEIVGGIGHIRLM